MYFHDKISFRYFAEGAFPWIKIVQLTIVNLWTSTEKYFGSWKRMW